MTEWKSERNRERMSQPGGERGVKEGETQHGGERGERGRENEGETQYGEKRVVKEGERTRERPNMEEREG